MRKSLKITSLAVAMSMALGFGAVASAEETTGDIPAPQNSKTVKANDDGTYDVALSFEGKVSTETNVKFTTSDVVIVADRSPSMNRDGKWDSLTQAVDVLVDKILPDNTNNQVSVVMFETVVNKVDFDGSYWTNSAEAVKTAFENNAPEHGWTNSPVALEYAEELLGTARDNSKKYVVFMSDGQPELYDQSTEVVRENAISAAEHLRASYPDAVVYSVGVPGCDEDFMKSVVENDSKYFYAEDAEELSTVFDGIATEIINGYENVVVSDTLSDYAEYVDYDDNGNPIFNVEVRDENGNVVDEASYDVIYDADTKTVSLEFGSEQIPDKWSYTLSYKVKPNDYANEYYAKNGYDAVGDENTDADNNATSSGKKGFQISTGKIEFNYRDVNYVAEFASPVFQVEEKEESSQEPSEPSEESSKEQSQAPTSSKPEGKPANNVPQTGDTQNIAVILAILAVSALGIVSVKMLGAKKSK